MHASLRATAIWNEPWAEWSYEHRKNSEKIILVLITSHLSKMKPRGMYRPLVFNSH